MTSSAASSKLLVAVAALGAVSATLLPGTAASATTISSGTTSASTTYLSDLTPVTATNGWGPFERNASNGESAAGDGRTLLLNGTRFARGLGVHSASDLTYRVPDGCNRFEATVGIDDEVTTVGSVRFQVYSGSTRLLATGTRTANSPNLKVSLPVTTGTVRLVVTDSGDGPTLDHADWAAARLLCAAPPNVPLPPPARDFTTSAALWNVLPSAPRIDADSAAISAKLAAPGVDRVSLLYTFGNKIYHADATTPRFQLKIVNAGPWGDNDLAHESVPIPVDAVPGTGTDGKLVIVDDVRRRVYDLWQVRKDGATWAVSWGGVYDLDGDGSSHNPAYGTGQFGVAWPQPVSRGTGSGLSTLFGTIKMAEIAAGSIPHALVFASDMTCGPAQTGQFRWPATTTDGRLTSGTCIPEGAKVQLDPSIDLAAIPGINKAELALGRAMQTYGAYCSDQSGSRMSFGFESPKAGDVNPYPAAGLAYDYYGLDRLPWSSLRVLATSTGA